MMDFEQASSIQECPDIELVWQKQRLLDNITVAFDNRLLVSHSDAGPFLNFMCPEGSHVIGPSTITCLKGGVWSDVTEPACSNTSLYGIAESDIVLIGVLAGSGAIVILTLIVIIAHLLCFRNRNGSETSSLGRLDPLGMPDGLPTNSYYIDDTNIYSISVPSQTSTILDRSNSTSHTLHLQRNTSFYDNSSLCNFSLPRYYVHSAADRNYGSHVCVTGNQLYATPHAQLPPSCAITHEDEDVFANHGYREEYPRNYGHNWNNDAANDKRLTQELEEYNAIDWTIF